MPLDLQPVEESKLDLQPVEEDFHISPSEKPLQRAGIIPALGTGMMALGKRTIAGLADVGDIALSNYQEAAAKEGVTDPVIGKPIPHQFGENLQALTESGGVGPLPAEDLRPLPKALQVIGRGAQGLIQTIPQLTAVAGAQAVGIPAPIAAAGVFGSTPEGFDPKQAAIAAALPFVGKYSGAMVEALASKLGVTKDAALAAFNKLGGATGAAGYLKAIDESEIAKLPPEQRDQARIDSWANVASQAALGVMGERPERAKEIPLEVLPPESKPATKPVAQPKEGVAPVQGINTTQ